MKKGGLLMYNDASRASITFPCLFAPNKIQFAPSETQYAPNEI